MSKNKQYMKKTQTYQQPQLLEAGKTAVLVERIINKAINENIDIDKLLVVTFTNAAASEMRERVLNAIYKKLDGKYLYNRLILFRCCKKQFL